MFNGRNVVGRAQAGGGHRDSNLLRLLYGLGGFFTFFLHSGSLPAGHGYRGPSRLLLQRDDDSEERQRHKQRCSGSSALSAAQPLPSGGKMAAAAVRGGGAAARPQRSCYPTPPSAPLPALPAGRSAGPRPAPFTPPPRKAVGPGCGRAFRRPPPPAAGSAPSPFSLSCSEPGREVGAASRRLLARLPPAGPGMKSGGTAIPCASARSRHDSNTAERRCGAALFLLPAGEAGSCRPGSRSAAWHRRGARRS